MARLALELAPATALPNLFLRTVPAWGVLAGLMLLGEGPALLASRWSPATVALVHVFTLGLLGNAMFGSLLQFLPAAAGVRIAGGAVLARSLHGLLNAGALGLVAGLWWPLAPLREAGGLLLVAAFALLAGAALPGLLRRAAASLLHAGIAVSLLGGLATAVLGLALVAAMSGRLALDLARWTDVHASVGLLAWVGVLIASVGRVVMPMFQGAMPAPATLQAALLGAVALGLPVLAAAAGPPALAAFGAMLAAAFALGGLWLQSRSRKPLQAALPSAWRAGLLAILAAAIALAAGESRLAMALALGAGLPLLVLSMLVEISAFLGWIELHRRCGRGLQLPGVATLLPPARRQALRNRFLAAAFTLPMAVAWPSAWTTTLAGLAWLAACLQLARAQHGLAGRVRDFALAHPPTSRTHPGASP